MTETIKLGNQLKMKCFQNCASTINFVNLCKFVSNIISDQDQ